MNGMRAYVRLALAAGLAASLGLAGLVVAQSQTKPGDKTEKQKMGEGTMHMEGAGPGMTMDTEQMNQMLDRRAEMMKKSGMPEEAVNQWKAMMSTHVAPDSPAGLLAYKDTLSLTPEQVSQLEAIQKEASQKAMAVLNDDQKAGFEKARFEPGNVMQMAMRAGRQAMMMRREEGMGMMNQGSEMKEKTQENK